MDRYILDSIDWCSTRVFRLPCVSGDPWFVWIYGITLWVPWQSNQWHAHAEEKEILLTVMMSKLGVLTLRFSFWRNCHSFCFYFNYFVCNSTESWSWTHKPMYSLAHTFCFHHRARDIIRRIFLLHFHNLRLRTQVHRMKFEGAVP